MRLLIILVFLNFKLIAQNWELIGNWNNSITALYADSVSDKLIIGGAFRIVNQDTMSGVAQWDGDNLTRMGCGIEWDCSDNLISNSLYRPYDFIRFDENLFAVGWFQEINGISSPGITFWDGQSWNPIEGGFQTYNSTPSSANGLSVINNSLYITGPFSFIQGIPAVSYCVYDGEQFDHPISFPNFESAQRLTCAAQFQGINYFAGRFNNATTPTNGDIWNIIKYENGQWVPVGEGIRGGMSAVEKMVVFQDKLYVAGVMSKSAGAPGNAIAAWDGQQWEDVGGGLYQQAEAHIYDMKVYNDKLHVVGTFSAAGGVPVNELAVWDGVNWCRVETDVQNHLTVIRTIEFYKDTLFLGGAFYDYENNIVTNKLLKRLTQLENIQCGNLTSVEQLKTEQIILFPNPTNGLVNLSFGKPVKGKISVNNLMGQLLINESVKGETTTLDLSNFSSGIYFLTFVDESGDVATKKLVVE